MTTWESRATLAERQQNAIIRPEDRCDGALKPYHREIGRRELVRCPFCHQLVGKYQESDRLALHRKSLIQRVGT